MPTNWKYVPVMPFQTERVVYRILDDGSMESCIETREDVQAWVAAGNTIEEEGNV